MSLISPRESTGVVYDAGNGGFGVSADSCKKPHPAESPSRLLLCTRTTLPAGILGCIRHGSGRTSPGYNSIYSVVAIGPFKCCMWRVVVTMKMQFRERKPRSVVATAVQSGNYQYSYSLGGFWVVFDCLMCTAGEED